MASSRSLHLERRSQADGRRPLLPCWLLALSAASVLMACSACKDRGCPISGEVTFDGRPIEAGTITFEPSDGQGPTTGGKITGGKYALTDNAAPMPGKKKVRIVAARKTGRRIPAGPPAPPDMMVEEIIRYVPKIYNERTTLTCDVSRDGSHQIDFCLKSK